MPPAGFLRLLPVCLAGALAFSPAARAQVTLGTPPTAPTDVSGFPGKDRRSDVTTGFSVNADSREQMRAFYNAVYSATNNAPINSTSDVATCFAGTNSTLFDDVVARRINWFRAAAGIPAIVTLDSGEGVYNQAAALIYSANTNISHFPPVTWECYSTNGAYAASNSNIAIGSDGADSITAYIWDFGANNTEVGHRRWILYPQTQVMATGDIPAQGNFEPANSIWVFDANFNGPRPTATNPYVAWPPQGYVPYQLVYPQWSFALSNADLSGAMVTMQSNGVNLAVSRQPYSTGFGENTVVWVPGGLDATSPATLFPFSGADTVYTVTVTNIFVGAATVGFTYTVTLFDPAVAGADYIPTTVSGPAQPGVGYPNNYTCVPPHNPSVTGYQWLIAQATNGNLFDGAENGPANFTAAVSPGYSVVTNGPVASGHDSFYLAMPADVDQTLQLNRLLFPAANTQLSFAEFLGYASSNQIAEVQISTNSGTSWQNIFSLAGTNSNTVQLTNYAYSTHSISLSNYASQPVLLRFNYHYAPGGGGTYFNEIQTNSPVGWFIDNILVTNTEQLVNFATNSTPSPSFVFTPTQATSYILQAQAVLFNQFPIGFGPITQVSAIVGASPIITLATPVLVAGQMELNFDVATGPASTFHLLQANQFPATWATNVSAVLTTNVPGSSYTFTTPVGPAARFYKVQTP
jgi:hypothetical protein